MDALSLIGIILAFVAIIGGNFLEGGHPSALLNAPAALIVLASHKSAKMRLAVSTMMLSVISAPRPSRRDRRARPERREAPRVQCWRASSLRARDAEQRRARGADARLPEPTAPPAGPQATPSSAGSSLPLW